jgi:murein DD-endopeptidase MepM/ murein hydrolase activator NlpD
MAIGGVALAALIALVLLAFAEPSQAGKPAGAKAHLVSLTTGGTIRIPESKPQPPVAAPAEPAPLTRTLKVRSGDTLMKILTKAGADRQDSHNAITSLSKLYNPRQLKVGQELTVTFAATEGDATRLAALHIVENVEREVGVRRDEEGRFMAEETVHELERRPVRAVGTIDLSLFEAANRAGLPDKVTIDLIRIFSFDVDFQREIQRGDRFEVFFDRFYDSEGRAVKDGDIHYAALTLSGDELAYYRYVPGDGDFADYFDAKGRSVKKSLMRTPIDGARLTSGYGKRRHPTLGYTKMHRGVDFGARTGTPIMAAGDGVVVKAGRFSSYGKYIKIRHNDTYYTAYAHMSRYAKGMRRGKRVRQGQVIGYVGTTGRSTGPHLHYEVLVKNRQVNPMKVRLPTGRKLKGKELARFVGTVKELQIQIAATPTDTKLAGR